MDRTRGPLFLFILALAPVAAQTQDVPVQPKPGAKVCLATVSNVSTRSALVDRLTERLAKNLKDEKIRAVAMDSNTTTDPNLHPPRHNADEPQPTHTYYTFLHILTT